jgi:hypothetical protein
MVKSFFLLIVTMVVVINFYTPAQNMAISVDGIDDYLEVFDAPSLDLTNALTIEAWYYFIPVSIVEPGLIQKDGPDSWGRYGIWLWNVNEVDFCLTPVAGSQQCLTPAATLTENSWTHIAAVYNGSSMEVFINGLSVGTQPFSSLISVSNLSLYVGGDVTESRYVKGYIDEVRIWNVSRTVSQIQQTMNDTLSAAYYSTPDSGLVAYYRFDHFEDLAIRSDGNDDIRDFSVNGNHGDTEGSPTLVISNALTAVEDEVNSITTEFSLFQNYPNPFNPTTKIKYIIPISEGTRRGVFPHIDLRVYDVLGRETAVLVNDYKHPGNYEVSFNGDGLPSGFYVYQLRDGEFSAERKMLLVK